MTTSTINPNIPATSSPLDSLPMRQQFQAAIADINALWTASDATNVVVAANTSAISALSATVTTTNTTVAKLGSAVGTLVSSFGAPNGTDDTATIQAAYNAAIQGSRKLIFDDPTGNGGTVWWLNSVPFDTSGTFGTSRISTMDTSTGLVTFQTAHRLTTGDVIQFVGSSIGAGGGTTQMLAYQEYFINNQSATTALIYDTKAHALAGGATGKIIPTTGATTNCILNAVTNTTAVLATNTTVTLTDASKLIVNDRLNFGPGGTLAFYKITNIVGNDITFTPAYAGSTVAISTTIWTTSLDVTDTLSIEAGTTFDLVGPSTSNNSFRLIVTSVVGSTVHFQFPPNQTFPTVGATQTFRMGTWIDPAYINMKFEIMGSPGTILKKKSTFSGNQMLGFFTNTNIYVHDLEMWGKTYGFEILKDPAIVPGDDGIRVQGSAGLTVERCVFRNFGDSALKLNSSTFWVGARSTSFPNAGVYDNAITVRNCTFRDVYQLSTTVSNDDYQGGTKDVWYIENEFVNIGGSVKFANRAPGAANVYLSKNVVRNCGRHAFELDSYSNYVVTDNTMENCKAFGVQVIANNLQPIGFRFDNLEISNNLIIAGALTASGGGGIFISTDLYPDNTFWDFKGLKIVGNRIQDFTTTCSPIRIDGGSFLNALIADNEITNCSTARAFSMTFRVPTVSGTNNNVLIRGNRVSGMTATKTTCFYIVPVNGAAASYIRGITISDNTFDNSDVSLGSNAGNDGQFVWTDYVQDLFVRDNWWRGYGGGGVYCQTEGQTITVQDNHFVNLNTLTGGTVFLNNVNGVRVIGNRLINAYASGNPIVISAKCQSVRIFNNDLTGSANTTFSVGNVPIKTNADLTRRIDWLTAAVLPSAGTWTIGDQVFTTTPTSGATPGASCTVAGSYSAITANATSDGSTAVLTAVSSFTNVSVGAYVTHAGFTGTKTILSFDTTALTITLSTVSTSIQTGTALTVVNPTFKNMANLA